MERSSARSAHEGATADGGRPARQQSAEAVLRIQLTMGQRPYGEHRVQDIADALGLNKPHVHKLLATMVRVGLAEQSQRFGTYRLTPMAQQVTNGGHPMMPVPDVVRDEVARLHSRTGPATAVAYHGHQWYTGGQVVIAPLEMACSMPELERVATAQVRFDPPHTAAGRVLVAHLAPSLAARLAPCSRLSPQEAAAIRDRSVEIWRAPRVPGGPVTDSAAAPVLFAGSPIGVLTVTAPTEVFAPQKGRLCGLLEDAARVLSEPAPQVAAAPVHAHARTMDIAPAAAAAHPRRRMAASN